MKKILFILILCVFQLSVSAQLKVNFSVYCPGCPIDFRSSAPNLAALNAYPFLDAPEGQRTWIIDIDQFRTYDGSSWLADPGGSGVSDGDKGEITIASSGTNYTVNNEAITGAKIKGFAAAAVNKILVKQGDSLFWDHKYGENVVTPEQYGAVGDGVADDSGALIAAIAGAGSDGIVRLTPNKTYLVENEINEQFANNPVTIIGYGATIKRADMIKSLTTATVASGATAITVADASVFSVGDELILIDTTVSKLDDAVSQRVDITSIVGNTINVDAGINLPTAGGSNYPINSILFKSYHVLQINARTNIIGVTFDGNRDNNDDYLGWNAQTNVTRTEPGSIIRDCIFKNIPNENVILGSGTIVQGNFFYDSYGSGVHISQTNSSEIRGRTVVSDNIFWNVCEIVNGHNEGAVTYSANSDTMVVSNNIAVDIGQLFIGWGDSGEDNGIICEGNMVFNAKGAFHYRVGQVDGFTYPIKFTDNTFVNCHHAAVTLGTGGQLMTQGDGFMSIIIADNDFINTSLSIQESTHISISDNTFHWFADYTYPADAYFTQKDDAIGLSNCASSHISDNLIHRETGAGGPENGIVFEHIAINPSNFIEDTDITTTRYIYHGSNTKIQGNTIQGFDKGVWDGQLLDNKRTYSFIAVEVANNTIFMSDSTTADFGIMAEPGMTIWNNHIYGNSDTNQGIKAYGIDSLYRNDYIGPIIHENVIVGITESIQLGKHNPFAVTQPQGFNFICTNNFIDGVIDDNVNALDPTNNRGSIVTGNITLPASQTPPLDWVRRFTHRY